MTPHRWHTLEALFSRAAELDPAARPLFLDAACRTPADAPDVELRHEVERLLDLDADARAFFDPNEPLGGKPGDASLP